MPPIQPSQGSASKPAARFRFSLRDVGVVVTVLCVLLAVPWLLVLLFAIGFWIAMGATVLALLALTQLPLWLVWRSLKAQADDEKQEMYGGD